MTRTRLAAALLCFAVFARLCDAAVIVLEKDFITDVKFRATIQFRFEIDHAKGTVNGIESGGKDGDLHMSGRPLEKVGLPMVAEIVNAAQFTDAVKRARATAKTEGTVTLTGVWRLWAEHPSKTPQKQNTKKAVAKPKDTNPDHVFEIHPITRMDELRLESSFVPIKKGTTEYHPYGAEAFNRPEDNKKRPKGYEDIRCTLSADQKTVTINTPKAGFNYVGFTAHIAGKPAALKDGGLMVIADLFAGEDDEEDAHRKRLIIAPGTPPFEKIKKASKGDEFEILAIPRISLIDLDSLASKPANLGKEIPLPYELIVVAARPLE